MIYGVSEEHKAKAEAVVRDHQEAGKLIDMAMSYAVIMGRYRNPSVTPEEKAEIEREAGRLYLAESIGDLLALANAVMAMYYGGVRLVFPVDNPLEIFLYKDRLTSFFGTLRRLVPESATPSFDARVREAFDFDLRGGK